MAGTRAVAKHPLLPFPAPPGPDPRTCELEAERARLVDRLLEVEREAVAGRLSAGMAHDVSNRLATLLGAAELALAAGDADASRAGLREVLETGRRIHAALDALEGFRAQPAGRSRPLPVADILETVGRLVEPTARALGVELLVSCATDSSVTADPRLLEQALVDLALRALRAAAAGGGRVVLSAADADPAGVRVTVRDTGGAPPAESDSEAARDAGLGLSTIAGIVEQFSGRLHVEAVGCGTRVEVVFETDG